MGILSGALEAVEHGQIDANSAEAEELNDVLALAISTALDAVENWTTSHWEVLLSACRAAAPSRIGRLHLHRYEVHELFDEAWQSLKETDDDHGRLIVRGYSEETETVMALLAESGGQ